MSVCGQSRFGIFLRTISAAGGIMGDMDCAAPCLLVASPLLLDPNFLQTVVLMVEHSEAGAMGVVLNRPLPVTVAQICEDGDMEYNGPLDAAAFYGGPVEPGRGTLLVRGGMPSSGDTVLDFTDFVSYRRDLLESLAKEAGSNYRLFLGYSGWAPGQLEAELGQQAWIRASLEPDLLFLDDPSALWKEVMKALMGQK
jgi:putative transcriptional regulator